MSIQIILNTTQDLTTLQPQENGSGFKFGFRQVPQMELNTFLLDVPDIETWDAFFTELDKGSNEVVGIWNKAGQLLTDENVQWKDEADKDKLKVEKNKFTKAKYKSKLNQILKYYDVDEETGEQTPIDPPILVDAPEDMQVNKIAGWPNRAVSIDEI